VRLLLDTHTLLWWMNGSSELGEKARVLIAAETTLVWVSAASAWEIAVKVALGRLELDEPPEVCLPRALEQSAFVPLPVSIVHALAVRGLPVHHRDPFDRLLVAQAQLQQLALVTADPLVARYDVPIIDPRD
jgi:PIN domain nuclease of toxin-antitoxin system